MFIITIIFLVNFHFVYHFPVVVHQDVDGELTTRFRFRVWIGIGIRIGVRVWIGIRIWVRVGIWIGIWVRIGVRVRIRFRLAILHIDIPHHRNLVSPHRDFNVLRQQAAVGTSHGRSRCVVGIVERHLERGFLEAFRGTGQRMGRDMVLLRPMGTAGQIRQAVVFETGGNEAIHVAYRFIGEVDIVRQVLRHDDKVAFGALQLHGVMLPPRRIPPRHPPDRHPGSLRQRAPARRL